jgi:hypothetical protein
MAGRKIGRCRGRYGFPSRVPPLLNSRQLTETSNNPTNPLHSSNAARKPVNTDDSTVDPREIDKVLSEVAGMIGRWHLFKRFIADSLKASCSVMLQKFVI